MLGEQTVRLWTKEYDSEEWQAVSEFPRTEFPDTPATIRSGKIGATWEPRDYGDKGNTSPCRVDWVKQY